MKNIITMVLLGLSIGAIAQDIQLDSIIYFYNDSDLIIEESFEYQNGLLSKKTIGDSEISLEYNDQQNLISYEESKFGILEEKTNLSYNEDNQLSYVQIIKDGQSDVIYDLSYVDNKLDEIELKTDINGQLILVRLQEYTYEDDIVTTDYYSGTTSNLHTLVLTEEYDDQGRLIKKNSEWLINDGHRVDSLIYAANGNLDRIYEVDYTDASDIQTQVKNLISDSSQRFTDIDSPAAFYETLEMISNYGTINTDHYGIFHGNKIESITTDDGYATWVYSILSSNHDERISAVPILVFPNPTQDFITVETDKKIKAFELYDMSGALLNKGSINANTIDVSNLTPGNFTIVYSDIDDHYYFAQFLKQ